MSALPDLDEWTIRSPWPQYSIRHFPDACRVEASERPALMDGMNAIIAVNWQATEPHWTASASPFAASFGLLVVHQGAALVAFSVYRTLRIAAGLAIYRCGTEVLPVHQGRGLYGFFTTEILRSSATAQQRESGILYGWRTRNPIVWAANARICDKVTPSLLDDTQDPVLQAACVEMCTLLYPEKPLELPAMIMRGAYGQIKHRRQAYHSEASLVDAAMSRLIPESADALFSVGFARV
jgi:hypothetical protein